MSEPNGSGGARHLRALRDGATADAVERVPSDRAAERAVLREFLPHIEAAVRGLPPDSRWRRSLLMEARLIRAATSLPLLDVSPEDAS